MKNIYDNGEKVLGRIYDLKEYIFRNCEDYEEVKEIIEELENYDEDTIAVINYSNGMGYSIDYWSSNDIINKESEEK